MGTGRGRGMSIRRRRVRREEIGATGLALLLLACVPPCGAQEVSAPRGADTDEAVVLNSEGADIREVIHSLATALGINYVIDSRVQGTSSAEAVEWVLPTLLN